jgi:hypothetical protein
MTSAAAVTGGDAGPHPLVLRAITVTEYTCPIDKPLTTQDAAPLVLHFDFVIPSLATTL